MSLAYQDLFEKLNKSVKLLQKHSDFSYLESLLETGENLNDNGQVFVKDGFPTDELKAKLEKEYKRIQLVDFDPEEIRRAFQLALIKGSKEDYLQPNHQITPDSIANFIAYLVEIIVEPGEKFSIADLSIGTGNLLWTIFHFLKNDKRQITLSGVDNDELLLSIASMMSAIQGIETQLIHDDALQNLLLEPVDLMISDLPVGYYPVNEQANKFQTASDEGHSYSHHLLIEQSLHYLKDGGFGFFLVPYNLFETGESQVLLRHIRDVGHMQGFIHLNQTMFKNELSRKSILILQKQAEDSKQASEVLLAKAPEFTDTNQMKEFLGEINLWKKEQFN